MNHIVLEFASGRERMVQKLPQMSSTIWIELISLRGLNGLFSGKKRGVVGLGALRLHCVILAESQIRTDLCNF